MTPIEQIKQSLDFLKVLSKQAECKHLDTIDTPDGVHCPDCGLIVDF